MRLRALELAEFRSFRSLQLPIEATGFRAIGPNASGKSTLLESIAMLATTRSPRTASEREIANWQSGSEFDVPPYARLKGAFDRADGPHMIEIGLSFDRAGQGALKKQTRFDDRAVRAVDAVGQFKSVLFSPEDVTLVAGPPSGRRRYIDMAVSQASRPYLRALSRYSRVLEQRNSLLRAFARSRFGSNAFRSQDELTFWDAELTAAAVEVLAIRLGAVAVVSSRANEHFGQLSGDDSLAVTYSSPRVELPSTDRPEIAWQTPPQALRQALSAAFARALDAAKSDEFRRGVTALGPHRDDLLVSASGFDLGRFGSRGQQRLAVIAIKLAELDLIEEAAGEPPVLLLDDALSELDTVHRERIIHVLAARKAQICVTATDEHDLGSPLLDHLPLLHVRTGTVEVASAP